MDDIYIGALERQIEEWERMYSDLKKEYDELKEKLASEDSGNLSADRDPGKLRHV